MYNQKIKSFLNDKLGFILFLSFELGCFEFDIALFWLTDGLCCGFNVDILMRF